MIKKRKETKRERQKRVQEILDAVFDEPFGKRRSKIEKSKYKKSDSILNREAKKRK